MRAIIHYFSIIAAATYSMSKNLAFSGDIRYNHTYVNTKQHIYSNDLTGNLSLNLYAGNFSVAPYLNFNKKVLDHTELMIKEIPINYGVTCSFSNHDFFAEIQIVSPFTNRKEQNLLDTPYYAYETDNINSTDSRYCNIKIAYTFDFGRLTDKIKRDIDNKVNSSLLQAAL